jgi:hypothetical protein
MEIRTTIMSLSDFYSCTTNDQRKMIFAADSSDFIFGFNQKGQQRWKVSTG